MSAPGVWARGAGIVAATGAFALVHSVLASRAAKRTAERALGATGRNLAYRPFYLAQSVVTFAALVLYVRRQPEHTLYRVGRPWSLFMRAGQLSGVIYAVWAAHHVGIPRMLGLSGVVAWARGAPAPPEPEAQGPAEADGVMKATGPFRFHRHPLNLAPLPVLWLFPRMTSRLVALNLASTVYLVLGSMHEEVRLRAAYGRVYARYQESGVPFYVPRIGAARMPPLTGRSRSSPGATTAG